MDNQKKKPFYHFCPYCYYEDYIKDVCPRCNGKVPWLKIKNKLKSNYLEIDYNSLLLLGKSKILRSLNLPNWEEVRSIGYPSEATKSSIGQKGENVLTGC
jgi:hypothetical protein